MSSGFLTDKEQRVLALDVRRKIYQLVLDHAGSHFREIERLSSLSTGVVRHHLDFLVKNGLLSAQKESKNLRYFPKEISSQGKEILSLLRQKSMRQVMMLLIIKEPRAHAEFVKEMSLSASTVSWHLKQLANAKVIRKEKEVFSLVLEKQSIVQMLITYRQSFIDSLVDQVIQMWDI